MLKKFLSMLTVAAMLLSCAAFAAETEENTSFRLEGEHFTLTVEGVETELTSSVIQTSWAGQSNNAGFYWNKTTAPVLSADFYAEEAGYYQMQYVANVFSSVNSWQNQYNITVNGETFSGGDATNLGLNPIADTGTEAVYSKYVKLNKGINTITFEATTATSSGAYLLYLDYVEFAAADAVRFEFESTKATVNTALTNHTNAALSGGIGAQLLSDSVNCLTAVINAEADGKYKFVWSASKYNLTNSSWIGGHTLTVNGVEVKNIELGSASQGHGNYYLHTAEVMLKKGSNDIIFTLSESSGANKKYVFYCDYIEYGLLKEEKSGVITIEGESPSSTDGATVAASNILYDSYSKDESGNKVKDEVSKISGGFQLISTKNIPATVTYSAKVPATGTYSMALDLFAQVANQTWLSPVAVTIMQNGSPVIDNVVISADGDYKAYDMIEDEKVQSIESCDITVDSGTFLFTTQYSNDIYRYNYLDSVELAEGDMELIITVLEERNTGAELDTLKIGDGYFGIDKITLTKNFEAEKALINVDKDIMNAGETQQLAVVDELNIPADDTYIVEWISSDENIATVDENGLLTAKNPGKAVITAVVKGESEKEISVEITVVSEAEQFIVHSASVNGNNVLVKYTALSDLSEDGVTFIAGRFPSEGSALAEVKDLTINSTASNICRIATIELDSADGMIKLFTWKSLEDMTPVFKVINVK